MATKKAKTGMTGSGERNPLEKKVLKIKKDKLEQLMYDADKRVQEAIIWLLANESFFGNTVILVKRRRTFDVPTMGVYYDNGFVMFYNPVFVLTLSKPYIIGIIKHEIFHLIFRHISRSKGIEKRDVWNLATDLAINSIIKDYIPSSGIFPDMEKLEPLNLEFNKAAEYYYKKLMSKEGQEASDDILGKSNYSVKIGVPKGDGGGNGCDEGEGSGDGDTVEVEIGGVSDVHDWDGANSTDKDGNKIPDELVEIDIHSLLKNAYNAAARKTNMWGNTPAGLIKEIEDFIFRKSEIPWNVLFRKYVLFAKNIFHIYTRQKRNRKYGYSFPGAKVKEKLSAVAIFDTSGSVSDIDYLTCANELKAMTNILDSLNIVHCDTEPYDVGKFTKHNKLPPPRHGYGGTEFEAPIRYAEKKYKPDVIIYLTDGYASWEFKPSKIPMIWIITNREVKVPKKFGKQVVLEPNPELAKGMAGDDDS